MLDSCLQARLKTALQESAANVEEWKTQLTAWKEESTRMKNRVRELEAQGGTGSGAEVQDLQGKLKRAEAERDQLHHEVAGLKSNSGVSLSRSRSLPPPSHHMSPSPSLVWVLSLALFLSLSLALRCFPVCAAGGAAAATTFLLPSPCPLFIFPSGSRLTILFFWSHRASFPLSPLPIPPFAAGARCDPGAADHHRKGRKEPAAAAPRAGQCAHGLGKNQPGLNPLGNVPDPRPPSIHPTTRSTDLHKYVFCNRVYEGSRELRSRYTSASRTV